jgi:hypothetical protein
MFGHGFTVTSSRGASQHRERATPFPLNNACGPELPQGALKTVKKKPEV